MVEVVGTQPTPIDGQSKGEQVARDALAGYVMGKWNQAYWDRNNVSFSGYSLNQRNLRCLRAARRKYNPEDPVDSAADIYIGVTSKIQRTLKAWIKDIVAAAGGKWGTLEPTPLPDLPEHMKDSIVQRLKNELLALQRQQMMQAQVSAAQPGMPGMPPMAAPQQAPGMLGPMQSQAFVSLAKQLKDSAMKRAFDMAKRSVARAERKILDQLAEGGMSAAMSAILDDFATFPYCILSGPFDQKVRKIVWKGNKAVDEEVVVSSVRRVSPFDFYWSVDSTNTQNGEWVAERDRMTQKLMYALIGMEGVDDDAVRETIDEYGSAGWALTEFSDAERERLEDRGTISTTQNGLIDVLKFCGLVPGKFLIDQAELAIDDVDRSYEVMVWVTAGRTLRCMFNPYPRGRRPYHKACFSDIPGTFAGEALAEILEDIQRMVNASARSLARNMAYSSGPIGEVNDDRLADGETVEEVVPYKLIHSKADAYGSDGKALTFTRVPSVAAELIAVEKRYTEMAHEHSGIPAYAAGQAPTGGAGRTLGGLSLLMSNAAKGVKAGIENVDEGIVQPLFEMEYDLVLLYDPDESLKADAQVVARGASGLLQRELNQGRAVELLQILQPFSGQMDPANPPVPPQSIRELLRQITEPLGLVNIVPNPEDSVGFELQQIGAMSPQAATAGPPLDGRSTSQMTPLANP